MASRAKVTRGKQSRVIVHAGVRRGYEVVLDPRRNAGRVAEPTRSGDGSAYQHGSREGRVAGKAQFTKSAKQLTPNASASEDLVAERDVLVVSAGETATLDKARALIELLGERLGDLEDAEMERLIAAVMPTLSERPQPAVIDQASRNAVVRTSFLQTVAVLTAEQVHEQFGSSARNRAALAARWRAEGKVFAVEHQGRLLYPAFQFAESGVPKPIVADVLAALGPAAGPWQIAIWFTTKNALLGTAPMVAIDAHPTEVLRAATDIGEPVEF